MGDEDERRGSDPAIKQPRAPRMRTIWSIGYIKRKLQERAAKRKEETPADKAARITATATKWMAVFTFVLMLVTAGTLIVLKLQLKEMHEGGLDTHELATQAGIQADAARKQSERTKTIAEQAVVQANSANALARQSLIQNRPWIGVDPGGVTSEPIRIDGIGVISTTVSTRVKNFGNVPGWIPTLVFASLMAGDAAHGNAAVSERLNRLMASKLPRGTGPSHNLFSGEGNTYINTTFATPESIEREPNGGNLMLYIVGLIVYTDPSRQPVHHTAFSYLYWGPEVFRPIIFNLTPGITLQSGRWTEYRTLVD